MNRSGDTDERKRQKTAKRQEAADRNQQAVLEAARNRFFNSPGGKARSAKTSGQRYFQIELPIHDTGRTWQSMAFGDVQTKTTHSGGQGAVLTEIEEEGWELIHAGFVFQETGQVSRDKFLSSGQSTQTTGQTFGVYLFKATEADARSDEPWLTRLNQWAADPTGRHEHRYWDGTAWTEHVSDGGVESTDPAL